MKKILSLMALLMLSITATWADTVDGLVAVDPGYTFIADNITTNGTKALTANTLYDEKHIFAPTANSAAANKGSSNFAGGTHLNSLRLKKTQDQLVFKVSKPCVVKFYTQSHGSRGIQAGSSAGGTQYGTQTLSTTEFECTIPAAGLVYLSSFGGDFFFAGFEVTTMPIFFDNSNAKWENVYIWAWNGDVNYTGGNWPGVKMTATGTENLYTWSVKGNPTQVIFSNGDGTQTADLTFEGGATYNENGKVVILNDYIVNLSTDAGWENAYAYTWTGDTHELGDWPGTPMTSTGAGTWTITVQAESAPANIIFHNNDGDQTKDLAFVADKTYEYNQQTYTATFTTDAGWETVYAYAWTTEGLKTTEYLGAWPGTPITATAGVYTVNIDTHKDAPANIQFNNGSDGKTPDLVFTEGRAYKWNTKVTPLFALAASEDKIPAGTTVNVTDAESDVVATLTYGVEGDENNFAAPANRPNDEYAAFQNYTAGNGKDVTITDGEIKSGTAYFIKPVYDGSITVGVWLNANKSFFITEDGTALEDFNGIKQDYASGTAFTFDVKAGKTYAIYCTGSKLGFYGFDYTGYTKPVTYTVVGTTDLTGTDPAWTIDDANNMVLNGETGLYEWTNDDIIVSSTTIPEFKVVKNGTTYYPAGDASTNWKITLGAISADVAGKYNLKITFNPSTDAIGVTGTKTYEAVTIGTAGWATTVTNSPLDFSAIGEYVEAYTATLSGTTVTLNKVENVPAETGLVLKGNPSPGKYYIPVIASSSTAQGNLGFSSTLTYTVDDSYKKCFGLTIKNGKAQFVKIKNAEVIPAQKAFLEVEPSTPANEFTVVFEDESGEATGIQTLNAERNTLNGETYNLAGQKVNKSYKGLVISNGKKVVMK